MKHLGDICKIDGAEIEPVWCITGGSPCQDLSVAGKRAGLDGERSGLFMEMIRIIKEMRASGRTDEPLPRFAIWENVYGAFSSNGGNDFRCVLEEFARIADSGVTIPRPKKWEKAGLILGDGWSIAWRGMDGQYWGRTIRERDSGDVVKLGTPQRRKRIALAADFNGHDAGGVLFGDSEAFRGAGK